MAFPQNMTKKKWHEYAKKAAASRKANGNMPKQRVDGTFKVVKTGKYGNHRAVLDGITFHSKAEAMRYAQLAEMQKLGMISELEHQPEYPCYVQGQLICTYYADFRYRIKPRQLGSRVLVEDVKGIATQLYRLKRKLVHALHPNMKIIEIPVRDIDVNIYRMRTADEI